MLSMAGKLERALQRLENIRGPDRMHYVRRLRLAINKLREADGLDDELGQRLLSEIIRIERRAQRVSDKIGFLTSKLMSRQFSAIGDDDDD